jgi:hypothetical protein
MDSDDDDFGLDDSALLAACEKAEQRAQLTVRPPSPVTSWIGAQHYSIHLTFCIFRARAFKASIRSIRRLGDQSKSTRTVRLCAPVPRTLSLRIATLRIVAAISHIVHARHEPLNHSWAGGERGAWKFNCMCNGHMHEVLHGGVHFTASVFISSAVRVFPSHDGANVFGYVCIVP